MGQISLNCEYYNRKKITLLGKKIKSKFISLIPTLSLFFQPKQRKIKK